MVDVMHDAVLVDSGTSIRNSISKRAKKFGRNRVAYITNPAVYVLAGAGGIEPPNGGIKIRCLTAWLRPNRLNRNARAMRLPGPGSDNARSIEAVRAFQQAELPNFDRNRLPEARHIIIGLLARKP